MALKGLKELVRKLYYFRYYRKFRGKAKNVMLSRKGHILKPEEITFGENIFIGRGFYISAMNLEFGSDIMIGPNVLIECTNHKYELIGKSMFSYADMKKSNGIRIENDVWIGGNVTILDGVTIGEGSVIGASSIITRSIPPYTVCVGNPCKPIKKRFDDNSLAEHLKTINSRYSINQIVETRNQYFKDETTYTKL
jgi:acetyltransferase-like isoleucine patch superfamily enzyme